MISLVLLCSIISLPRGAHATIVEFETAAGTFEVNLYDLGTPATVANFLSYVSNGAYNDSIIHRSMPGFVVQGGGFVTDMNATVSAIPQNPAVSNEPVYSNVRGTIAMAKLASGPDTATNQWFFNLTNSASNLDNQNGGFTVFGQVTGNGMATVDAIAALPTYNQSGAFSNIPLQNYTAGNPVLLSNLVVVTSITVKDSTVDSAGVAGLNPPLTTRNNNGGGGNGGNGGGGSLELLFLLGLLVLGRSRILR
jgi:cyclophilin family peptidyl-prolyl cis-trans isomerase